jgi:tetratricopeptide (TPR) repeat protein
MQPRPDSSQLQAICPPNSSRASTKATQTAYKPAIIASASTAIAQDNSALQLNPDDVQAFSRRAFAYQMKGDTERAIADYGMVIELDPGRCDAWIERGRLYHYLGDYDHAIADFSKAIELDPGCGPMAGAYVHNKRGLAYVHVLAYDRAIADYDKATQIAPGYAWAFGNLGLAYEKKGDLEKAVTAYDSAIRVPGNALAYCYRGLALAKQGKNTQAARDLEDCIGLLNCDWGIEDEDALLEQVQVALGQLGKR